MKAGGPRLVVVGGGPAGVMAAVEAARWDMQVILIDDQSTLGGQYYRARRGSTAEGSPQYLRRVAPAVHVRLDTCAFDVPEAGVLSTWDPEHGATELHCDSLVLATGAYDRPIAIPGWTLPGVMTAGGAHRLAAGSHVVPGARAIVAGAGPFLLDVANALSSHGCHVTVVEATRRRDAIGGLPALLSAPAILAQAAGYLWLQALRRWTVRYGELVTAIHGNEHVEGVSISRVDRQWRAIQGTEQRLPADAVCLGFGFVPQLDLAQLAGCALDYDAVSAAFVIATDDFMRTSVPRIYAAGESVGTAGMRAARLRGRLAGLSAAHDAGRVPAPRFERLVRKLQSGLGRYTRVAAWASSTYGPRPALWGLARDDTVVCRCEDVLLGDIERALEVTEATPVAVKTLTRAGMGLCQGKMCGPSLAEFLRTRYGFEATRHSRPWSVRPPVCPVPLADWIDQPDPREDCS